MLLSGLKSSDIIDSHTYEFMIGIDITKGYLMIDNRQVKEILFGLGADLCGIAGIDRFDDAPEGYHPTDVLPTCRSVISFGCRFPTGTLRCNSHVPYTRARNSITSKMDAMALDFCIEMEKYQIVCVPVPTNESQWDEKTGRWRSAPII